MRPLMLSSQAPFVGTETHRPDSTPPAPASYRPESLFSPPADHGFRPTALNDRGDIIGNLVRPPRFEAGAWVASGVHLPAAHSPQLGGHQAENGWPYHALSSSGLIAGTRGTPARARRAWASHLGDFGETYWPGSVSIAQGVNAAGIVVGKTLLPIEPVLISRAFIIGPTGRPRFLNAPEGGMTNAVALNDAGTVLVNVSSLSPADSAHRAWLWHDQVWEPLETPADCSSVGTALSADGIVAGLIQTAGGLECAALWIGGRLVDLGTPFALNFRPLAGHDARLLVGTAVRADGRSAAVRWTPREGVQFLDDLLAPGSASPPLASAVDLNGRGQIIATSHHGAGSGGFLLQPLA